MGAAVVRAYGLEDQTDRRVKQSDRRALPGEDRGALARGRAVPDRDVVLRDRGLGDRRARRFFGPEWGLTFGRVSAFIFLSDVFLHVFMDLPEIYADTQTAIAGWRKILTVLDLPIEIVEPEPGIELPVGPIEVRTTELDYSYREGGPCCAASRSRSSAARTSRSSARRRRQDDVREAAGPAGRPRVGADPGRRHRPAGRVARRRGGARSGWSRRTGSCSTRPCARTFGTAADGERPRRRDRVRGARAGRLGRVAARGPGHARSANGARRSRSASANWWRSRARRSTRRAC